MTDQTEPSMSVSGGWCVPRDTPYYAALEDETFEGFPKPTFTPDDLVLADDPGVARAGAFVDALVGEWMRQQTEREALVAAAAAAMHCGYAVIEERSDEIRLEENRASSVLVYHYVLGPWIPSGQRLAFPSWGAWEAWQGRGRPL